MAMIPLLAEASRAATIVRYDVTGIFDDSLSPVLVELKPSFRARNKLVAGLHGAFHFDVECIGVDDEKCEMARKGLGNVGTRLSAQLDIGENVRIKVTYRSFCAGQDIASCPMRMILGAAKPSSYFRAKTSSDDAFWFYPQALFKQLNIQSNVPFQEYDILTEFNADYNFWFQSSNEPIQPGQEDFEMTVAHELVHGMGMDHSFAVWNDLYAPIGSTSPRYLAPKLDIDFEQRIQGLVQAWLPLTIFDKHLYETGNSIPLSERAKIIQSFQFSPGTPLNDLVAAFEASGAPFESAKTLYQVMTSGRDSIEFRSSDSSSLILSTPEVGFIPGISLSHVNHDRYWNSPEFLMTPAAPELTGLSLDAVIARNGGSGVFGQGTLALLNTLGWKIAGQGVSVIDDTPVILDTVDGGVGVLQDEDFDWKVSNANNAENTLNSNKSGGVSLFSGASWMMAFTILSKDFSSINTGLGTDEVSDAAADDGSWQGYVDTNLVGTGKISKAAIHGHDGNPWATSAGFNVSVQEAQALAQAFNDASGIRANGLHVGGVRHIALRCDDRSVYGKQRRGMRKDQAGNHDWRLR
ncbi:MAG: hypothetical protein SGCHY_004662 [Lobulomycetales sp.]